MRPKDYHLNSQFSSRQILNEFSIEFYTKTFWCSVLNEEIENFILELLTFMQHTLHPELWYCMKV